MSQNSDNNDKPRTNIFDLFPEVYRSDLNETLFETSFNRHLTKDDTVRISGFIGEGNPQALVDRQIEEPTPHRQAFQLQPIMYTKIGSVDHTLTQQGFLTQLELLGVDINRLPQWGNTLQFNWVPPINIDMLTNYFNYYWASNDPNDPPQYFTIENRCNKARSKVYAYEKIVAQKGELHPLLSMDVKLNQFVVSGDLSDLMTEGFVFFTKNTTDVNLVNKFWTASSSTYNVDDNETTITTQENIAIVTEAGDPTPTTTEVGRLWYKSDTDELFRWNGVTWILIPPTFIAVSGDISLTELLTLFQRDANCVCNEDFGWDLGLWDDNQLGNVLWNETLLNAISHPTEAAWIIANGAPTDLALWYNTTDNQLYQYFSGAWNLIFNSFSTIVNLTTGNARWDMTIGCVAQELNQWSEQNKWIHKTEIQSFSGIVRAQIPIIEYNSTIEMNAWARVNHAWKYRALVGDTFESIGLGPCIEGPWRIELEPVKGYAAAISGGKWYVYLFERDDATLNRDINHTVAFTPGTVFRIRDDGALNQLYTVVRSEFRKIKATDPVNVVLGGGGHQALTDYYVTVVEIEEPVFTAPSIGGGILNARIEPTLTSRGDIWKGYHIHWLLDVNGTTVAPAGSQPLNPELVLSLEESAAGVNPTYDVKAASGAVSGIGNGVLEIGRALCVFTPNVAGVTTISFNFIQAAAGYQEIDFTVGKGSVSATGLANDATVYTATATIEGVDIPIAVTGASAQTFADLVTELISDLGAAGTAQMIGGRLRITSAVEGEVSSVLLTDTGLNPLFSSLTDFSSILTSVNGDGNYVSLPPSLSLPPNHSFDLQYDITESRFYATPGSNELRVFVNDIQQYGTYVENIAYGTPNYTAIGSATTSLATIPYVSSITFVEPLQPFDVVRIEICPATYYDMGLFAVPVRTIENETTFTASVAAGTQPEYRSLSQYHYLSQAKVDINQYPLFNVYEICPDEVCENPIIKASPLFAYKEDAACPINPNVRRRIFATPEGRDYTFIQYLLDRDDNILYGYRNLDKAPEAGTYWYNTDLKHAYVWDGTAWTDTVFVGTSNGITVRKIIMSATEPTDLLTVEGALWMDTANEKLYQRDTVGVQWLEQFDLIIASADPTLETVWKNGNNHEYVPEYVDADRNPTTVGDPSGDWELLDQWFYNSEHKNKAETRYTQLVTHFSSIIEQQPDVPGFYAGGVFTLTQNQYDYGLGGIIKEHNDSFDTLISAVNVNNVTPVGLMEWAEDQYALGLLQGREFFNANIKTFYGNFSEVSLLDQQQYLIDEVVQQYKLNDFLATVYGDTTAYNVDTDVGMPNWIATAPIFHLSEKYRPHLLEMDNSIELFHHDGHRSRIFYTPGEEDRYTRQIISQPDNRVTGGTLGVQSTTVPPATEADFLTAFSGTEVRTGVYWYRLVAGVRTLYRFIPFEVVDAAPSFFFDGEELPDGTRYYNTVTNLVYIKSGLSWVADTGVPFDISTLWVEVDIAADFANIALSIEQRLYDAVSDEDTVFDYSSLTPTASEQDEYDRQYERRFYAFVAERNIQAPLVNTTYSATDAFTWNYVNSLITTPPRLDITPDAAAAWQELYTRWYGTPYPHLEPWKLQGYHDKPTWWDGEYLDTTGNRRWIYNHGTTTGMWENIRVGAIPVGRDLPDGSGVGTGTAGDVSNTFVYFSVNIDDVAVGGYDPDEAFPPYLSSSTTGFSTSVRSLFSNLSSEISGPDADYLFGDVGPAEWEWTVSSEYVYDIPIIAFLMQPARFLHYAIGLNFIVVDKLQVETTFCQVYSHEDALFHSDIYNQDQIYSANGLNQWYVNFNRATGYDTSNEFRYLWAGWNPRQGYQFAGIIDTSTFNISSKYFDVITEDYQILLANTGVFRDMWAEGFEVSVLNIPPAIVQYNNQALWRFDVDSLAVVERELNYYGVRLYPYALDATTNEGTFFKYDIIDASAPADRFFVPGNQTDVFYTDVQFDVSGATPNVGTYTTVSSVYEPASNRTRINVQENVVTSVGGGQIDVSGFISPWVTGQQVVVSSTRNLPVPLLNGVPYFIINTGPRTFQLAETYNDAIANNPIDLTTPGDGELRIGEIASTFIVFGGSGNSREVWYHYALDKNRVRTATPPTVVQSMQSLINFFDGYAEYQRDQGEIFNTSTTSDYDGETGRAINWQFEVERFINWAYGLRRTRLSVADRFEFALNATPPTEELLFSNAQPSWTSGTAISFSTTGSLPSPLIAGVPYYFVQTNTPGVFKVSITSNTNVVANHITFTTAGSGTMYVAQHRAQIAFPSLEVNPTLNNIWYDTPQGIMANIVTGPYADIRVSQTIFDQYGRQLTPDKLNVYRLDKLTRIAIRSELTDDLSLLPVQLRTDRDYLHLGGGHFFMEGYEHVLLFNDYTVGDALIYDQFFGLYAQRFNLDYFEKEDYTLRPTLGGFYLIDGQFQRNIEGSTVDLHNYYDTYDSREGTLPARYARNLLGYKGTENFLDLVNIKNKSQFLFYQGLIQYKGSVAGAIAYVNSRRFVDAKVDEYWAWKIAEFGDPRPKINPEIKLFSDDTRQQDVRMHFLAQTETTDDVDVAEAIDNDFIPVDFNDGTRWEIYPEQKAEIMSPLFLDAEVSSMYRVYVSTVTPTAGETNVDYWYDRNTSQLKEWNGTTWATVGNAPLDIKENAGTTHVRLTPVFDDARVIRRKLSTPGDLREYETVIYAQGGAIEEFEKVNSEIIKFQTIGFGDIMIFFTINPGFDKISPSKLLDKKANTVVDNVQLWDPARDHHSSIAIHNVDLQNATDPAGYSVTVNPANQADFAWNGRQEGVVWLDTNQLGYKTYYDDKLYPDVNDRLNLWGQLAEWSDVRVYEWVGSPVPPTDYADLVAGQAEDLRPQRSKATGEARQTLFRRDRAAQTATIDGITSGSLTIDFTPGISGATSTGLASGTQGYQDIDFTTTFVGGDPTGLIGTGPFQATVFVDGINYLISVTSASATTYTALVSQITTQLLGSAAVTIFDTDTIRITSNSTGLGSTVFVQDINLFNSLADAPAIVQLPVNGTSTTYTATITLDGDDYGIGVLGDDAQTFTDLVDVINSQISGVGSIAIVGGDLVVTSTSVGTESTVTVTGGTLFGAGTDLNTAHPHTIDSGVAGTYGQVKVPAGIFEEETTVLFTTTDTLPDGLESSTNYLIAVVTPAGPDDLLDLVDGNNDPVLISTIGVGTLSIVPSFGEDWIRVPFVRERQYGAMNFTAPAFEPTITLTSSVGWLEEDKIDVYINDIRQVSGYTLDASLTVDLTDTDITINELDIIDIVRPLRALTDEEESFDPDTEDDGTVLTQWQYDYEYSVVTTFSGSQTNVPSQTYYFWVENSQFRNETEQAAISAQEIAQQIATIPTPYFVVQLPKDDPSLQAKYGYGLIPYGSIWSLADLAEQFLIIPVFYRQAILRKASDSIAQDDRFVWKFTRDLTLRTKLNNRMNLKNKHQEWLMFRREQPSTISRELWDRLTEALMGYTLTDSTVRVPSLERQLYDTLYGTDTRFGLGEDQAFVDANYALATIIAYLSDPNRDFTPVNIDSFFATYSFDTPENIRTTMDVIYNSFTSEHVNNVWFETLSDALATRAKYKELLKTSWVALHGIRVLEVGGLFDD